MEELTTLEQASRFRRRIPYWITQFRSRHGLGPVVPRRELSKYAQDWAYHLDGTDKLYHSDLTDLLGVTGRPAWVGEVIAFVPDQYPPRAVVRAWIRSAPHREILLEPRAEYAGTGAVWDVSRNAWVISTVFSSDVR